MPSLNRKCQTEPDIVVPKPSEDRPKYGRVGLIAGIGFVVGIAWPGLARLELVPRPPSDDGRASSSSASAAATVSVGMVPEPSPSPSTLSAEPPPKTGAVAKVRLAEVIYCVDADGRKHKKCGELNLDKQLVEPLRSLVACDGVSGSAGVLSLGLDVNFDTQQLNEFTVGRSTTFPANVATSLLTCAKSVLTKVELTSVEHAYNRYRLFYLVEFPSAASSGSAEASAATASAEAPSAVQGTNEHATVAWEVALIRKTPKNGEIAARVLRGTKLTVTGRQGDWYRVKYDAQGSEGYVFKAAIGM